ncbi:RNA polymerase sigma factor [Catenovulum sp. SM1970]|nr:RNA polymerase sigma factor [Marinifaba aquimaris]
MSLNPTSLNGFLISVEKKAYQMAVIACRNEAEALDIVQDAMLKFAVKYSEKPSDEWKPLFYRIVQNLIMDWHRRQKVRRIITFWKDDDEQAEPWLSDEKAEPEQEKIREQMTQQSLLVLQTLPVKQQQCFLLRAWEGLSVKETAQIMNCSEGSVKTHFSRASGKLKQMMETNDD